MSKLFNNTLLALCGAMLTTTIAYADDSPLVKVLFYKPLAAELTYYPSSQIAIQCNGDFIAAQPQTSTNDSPYLSGATVNWSISGPACMGVPQSVAMNFSGLLKGNGQRCTAGQLCTGAVEIEYINSSFSKAFSAKGTFANLQNASFYNSDQNKTYYFIGCFDQDNASFVCCFSADSSKTSCN